MDEIAVAYEKGGAEINLGSVVALDRHTATTKGADFAHVQRLKLKVGSRLEKVTVKRLPGGPPTVLHACVLIVCDSASDEIALFFDRSEDA